MHHDALFASQLASVKSVVVLPLFGLPSTSFNLSSSAILLSISAFSSDNRRNLSSSSSSSSVQAIVAFFLHSKILCCSCILVNSSCLPLKFHSQKQSTSSNVSFLVRYHTILQPPRGPRSPSTRRSSRMHV